MDLWLFQRSMTGTFSIHLITLCLHMLSQMAPSELSDGMKVCVHLIEQPISSYAMLPVPQMSKAVKRLSSLSYQLQVRFIAPSTRALTEVPTFRYLDILPNPGWDFPCRIYCLPYFTTKLTDRCRSSFDQGQCCPFGYREWASINITGVVRSWSARWGRQVKTRNIGLTDLPGFFQSIHLRWGTRSWIRYTQYNFDSTFFWVNGIP